MLNITRFSTFTKSRAMLIIIELLILIRGIIGLITSRITVRSGKVLTG